MIKSEPRTEEHMKRILDQILEAWKRSPHERLFQLFENAKAHSYIGPKDRFYQTDLELVYSLEWYLDLTEDEEDSIEESDD